MSILLGKETQPFNRMYVSSIVKDWYENTLDHRTESDWDKYSLLIDISEFQVS